MLMRRKQLEAMLGKVKPHPKPQVQLEQYQTPASIAASMLWTAAFTYNDIECKGVCDLGCGTGLLGIGAAYLGAHEVIGVDIDKFAIETARSNARAVGVSLQLAVMDIDALHGDFDTVIQNPPFGVKHRGADVRFLKKALNIGSVVYSIHKTGVENRAFLKKVVEEQHGRISVMIRCRLTLPHQYSFHRKPIRVVEADIYRVTRE